VGDYIDGNLRNRQILDIPLMLEQSQLPWGDPGYPGVVERKHVEN
jgi:hypothetical protein